MITKLEEFKVLGDHRGQLVALEANSQIPFDVKRVFIFMEHKREFQEEIILITKQNSF